MFLGKELFNNKNKNIDLKINEKVKLKYNVQISSLIHVNSFLKHKIKIELLLIKHRTLTEKIQFFNC